MQNVLSLLLGLLNICLTVPSSRACVSPSLTIGVCRVSSEQRNVSVEEWSAGRCNLKLKKEKKTHGTHAYVSVLKFFSLM